MCKLKIIFLIGIPLISLLIVPNLAFGDDENEFWDEGYTITALKDGFPWVAKATFMEPIALNSPECQKLDGAFSPQCQEASLYQITALVNWELVGESVYVQCEKYTKENVELTSLETTREDSFSQKIGSTMRHESTQSSSVTIEDKTTAGASVEYGGMKAHVQHEHSYNRSYSHEDKSSRETTNEIQKQSQVGQTVLTSSKETTTHAYDLEKDISQGKLALKMQQAMQQQFMTIKYDLWTPVTKYPGDDILPNAETKVMKGNLKYKYALPGEVTISVIIEPIKTVNQHCLNGQHAINGLCISKTLSSFSKLPVLGYKYANVPITQDVHLSCPAGSNLIFDQCIPTKTPLRTVEKEYRGAHYFKAYDLPGDQYYIHTTYTEKYPTKETKPRVHLTAWDCNTNKRIVEDHTDLPEPINALNVIMRPTKHHANIIVIDNEYIPVAGAIVKLGIPSFPLTSTQTDACTSIGRDGRTDIYGSAYFYLGSEEKAGTYVYDGINEESKPDGLVAMFPGNGDFTDLVSPDRVEGGDMVIPGRRVVATDVSFGDGMMEKAFDFNIKSQGFQIEDSDDFDLTKAVTLSAWIKPTSFAANEWQAIITKSLWPTRDYGLYLHSSGSLHLSYLNAQGQNVRVDTPANSISQGEWTHVVGVIDIKTVSTPFPGMMMAPGTMKIYINGQEAATGSALGDMVPNDLPLGIGVEPKHYSFAGSIDEVAIYNKALSEPEIQNILGTSSPKSSACEPGEVSSNQTIEVTKSGFKPISRDLAFDEQYGVWYIMEGPVIVDNDPPLLVVPKTKYVEATSESGANVDYTATAYDAIDKEITPGCNPPPGAEFPIGLTKVNCSAKDSSGNEALESFNVIVTSGDVVIPPWVKGVAGFWCADEIGSDGFVQVIQWMIDNNLIIIPEEIGAQAASTASSSGIPDWIQENACWWYEEQIDDKTFSITIQWLIDNGIIQV